MVELNYGRMMQRAMQSLVAEALSIVSEHGLHDDHHFYITFRTAHPGVDMPDWLRAQFPKEMVIVLQYEFHDLAVTKDRFSVRLSFSNRPATLVIPFAAVLQFADPSAEFGLRFDQADEDPEAEEDEEIEELERPRTLQPAAATDSPPGERRDADIVDLDAFRKK